MIHIHGRQITAVFFRNIIFGIEDSLVSTVGLISGIVAGGVSKQTIILTGMVLIFVEALSMAIGSMVSEQSAEEYIERAEVPIRSSVIAGGLMFISYFFSGFVPLLPYLVFERSIAIWVSIGCTLGSLAVLGFVSARYARVHPFKHSLRMTLFGGTAIAAGMVVGSFIQTLL